MDHKQRILLTGATGYVGGKLLKRLQLEGYDIHCLARNPDKLKNVAGAAKVFRGDVMDIASLWGAFQGVETAFYLIHSLSEKRDFETREIEAAQNFASMARLAGIQRIIYLGGLGNERDGLSPHLQSRQNVGHALRATGIQTIELRASIVLGKGSLSYNLIRDLTEHLPFMVMPRWASTKAQPIGIRDLLDYLVQSVEIPIENNEIVEIGGSDRMSYGDLMREYAKQSGIRRIMVPVPVLTPWLSSHWISFFSSVDPAVGRKLIEGIKNPTIVEDSRSEELFDIKPAGALEAIRQALDESTGPYGEPWLTSRYKEKHVYAA